MRVSAFVPSESRPGRTWRAPIAAIAALYLATHLASLPPSLEDLDSINFALGLHDFDPAQHQPHPPGYPIYIALGRISLAFVALLAPGWDSVRQDAWALAVWSALGGAAALVGAAFLYRELDGTRTSSTRPGDPPASAEPTFTRRPSRGGATALLGTGVLAAAPLFWMTGLRPMSDMPGLAVAIAGQALLIAGRHDGRALVAGAFVASLAAGFRVQALWLTVPLLMVALVQHARRGAWRLLVRSAAAVVAGALAWAIPLTVASGGVEQYLAALGTQAGEDFIGAEMLWASPTPRRLAFAAYQTLVLPWASIPLAVTIWIAGAVGAIALVLYPGGTGRMTLRARLSSGAGVLLLLGVAYLPYALFHLVFQDTAMVRYALPLLVPTAYLAGRGIAMCGQAAPLVAGAIAVWALAVGAPAAVAYGSEAHPAFRAIADLRQSAPASVFAHYALRRPLEIAGERLPVAHPRQHYEWLGLVDYWRQGRTHPVVFVADPRRTDLDLIDPVSRRDVRRYRWRVAERPELNGTRPTAVDLVRITSPRWLVGEGWSLTPETGGLARQSGRGLERRPIEGYIRRGAEPLFMLIGGRHLGTPQDGAAILSATLDGREIATWTVEPAGSHNFLQIVPIAAEALAGNGRYAELRVRATGRPGTAATPPVAIRQFDVQPQTGLIHGYAGGWHEAEYDNATGRRWRWTSDRADLRIVPPQAVTLTIRGESPLKYVDAPPSVQVIAGGRTIAEFHPADDFEWQVRVPADAVLRSGGVIAIETNRVYLPGAAEGTGDARRLGLRIFDLQVNPLVP